MAVIILGHTKCCLCGEVVLAEDAIVSSCAFLDSPEHPLWRFSDAAMHYDCFQEWPMRTMFVAEYNSRFGCIVWGNGTRHYMQPDGVVLSENV